MAEALGWPEEPIGFADLADRSPTTRRAGASVGHPEWGPFRLGKTNPNFSTSGLNFTIAEYYAATGKTSGPDDRGPRPPGRRRVRHPDRVVGRPLRRHHDDVPQQLVRRRRPRHVADLRQRRRRRGEERHRLQPRQPRRRARRPARSRAPPRGAAGRDLPGGGDAVLRQPVHRARHRVGRRRREGGGRAVREVRPAAGEPAEGAGVRVPAEQPRRRRSPIRSSPANGVDPTQPTAELEVPSPEVLVGILDSWAELRKDARVLLVLDISGSMGELGRTTARPSSTSPRRRRSAPSTSSRTTDDVGLWVFSTDLGGADPNVRELVPIGPIGATTATRSPTPIERPVPDERHAAVRGHRAGVRDDGRAATTRRRSTPSCC